jgi:transcriptional regulator with XRE-family HTH domain
MKKPPRTKSARLAGKLRQIRLTLNLSQTGMLERLGFGAELFRSNISQYEHGRRVPPLPVLLEYARLANVGTGVLIDDDLDLPQALPSPTKHEGIRRKATSRNKPKR